MTFVPLWNIKEDILKTVVLAALFNAVTWRKKNSYKKNSERIKLK